MSKEKVETVVKDLIDLHKDTVKNQNAVLKVATCICCLLLYKCVALCMLLVEK